MEQIPYQQFLANKVRIAQDEGFVVEDHEINPALKPHNRLMVKWMVAGGRRACFAAFGLHKTVTQLEAVRLVLTRTGGRGLIICPLGVRQEFRRDAVQLLGWEVAPKFIRTIEEAGAEGIYLTNYESVRDGKLDPRLFQVASLDEASVLRGFGGSKTFREFMRLFTGDEGPTGDRRGAAQVPYRFVATATPSPNDYIELLAYADFLGVMDVSQAKTRFFKRDSTQADKLTLHAHKEEEFWLWVASWALFVSKPSDLTGDEADDAGYVLPELDIRWHELPSDHSDAGFNKWGQGLMFKDAAIGLQGAAQEKRDSLEARIGKMMDLLDDRWAAPEPADLEEQIIDRVFGHVAQHQVLQHFKEGQEWREAAGVAGSSSPVWWDTDAKGIRYYPEGLGTKAVLIPLPKIRVRAEAWQRKHVIIWHDLENERRAIEKALPRCATVYGSQDLEEREQIVVGFSEGQIAELGGKPSMLGSGTNLQHHCHWAIYLGIGFKFNDFIQSIHRLLRFGQKWAVRIDIIYTEAERTVRRTLERKWQQHNKQVQKMIKINKEFGLSGIAMAQMLTRKMGVERIEVTGQRYRCILNDNVPETQAMPENSVGLALSSWPFTNQYEYSPNYADFGHTQHPAEFFEQMDYLTPQMYRVLKPGRLYAVHVKDRIIPGGMTGLGFPTMYPFHIDAIEHMKKHGFAFVGMKTIVTDVVRENNQTYRLGWTEQCKDGTKMGFGVPEYLLLFRKPQTDRTKGYADEPVVKSKPQQVREDGTAQAFNRDEQLPLVPGSGYSRSRWQVDAHGFARSAGDRLMDPKELQQLDHDIIFKLFKEYSLTEVYNFEHHVKIGETLEGFGRMPTSFMLLQPQSWHDDVWTNITRMLTFNGSQWSKGKEMHLCPMQFDIADRAIAQWSNPGDIVYDPFGGLMTVPYRAILQGRIGWGCELNPSYFSDGLAYC